MAKIIISTHHKLADGFRDTLNYILPNSVEVIPLSAYLDNKPLEDNVDEIFASIPESEQIIAFTDMLGGSVNQEFAKRIGRPNYHLITGTNLPVLLSIALQLGNGDIDANGVKMAIEDSRSQIIYVNDELAATAMDEDDE